MWVCMIAYIQVTGLSGPERLITDPAEVVWKRGDTELRVHVEKEKVEPELEKISVTVVDQAGGIHLTRKHVVNSDLFGGGFVGAVQADGDPELELIFVDRHRRSQNGLVDFAGDSVVQKPLTSASPELRQRIEKYLSAYSGMTFAVVLYGFGFVLIPWTLFAVVYYLLYHPIRWLAVKLPRHFDKS